MKIVTIWWWNAQSNLLRLFNDSSYFCDEIELSSIVAMSDDWRTTWILMRELFSVTWKFFSPMWDVRKCLYSLSNHKKLDELKENLENIFDKNEKVRNFNIKRILEENNLSFLEESFWDYLDFKLPFDFNISGHKTWNILIAILIYNIKNNQKVMDILHTIFLVRWTIIPVTFDEATIRAELENGEIIETQDKISNEVNYDSNIKNISLLDWLTPQINPNIREKIDSADYIIISSWDLFTSIFANFLIWDLTNLVKNSKAKKVIIFNNNNKKWETTNYWIWDFIKKYFEVLWFYPDFVLVNDFFPSLEWKDLDKFKSDISVKWWDYIVINNEEKKYLEGLWIKVISWDYIDKKSLYKHNSNTVKDFFEKII